VEDSTQTVTRRTVNRQAVAALRRAWIPGYGLLAGRRALRQIKWTGEEGRSQALRAIRINSVVTGALLAGLVVANLSGGTPHRDSVLSLKTGQCFDRTGERSPDPVGGYRLLDVVRGTDCAGPHNGEVFGRWDAGRSWTGGTPDEDALAARGNQECARLLPSYAMDSWRLPGAVHEKYYTPTRSGWTSGVRTVVCTVETDTDSTRTSGSVRLRAADLTPDQAAYLAAVDAYTVAGQAKPKGGTLQDPSGWRRFGATMAAAAGAERRVLRAHPWPAAAAGPVAALETKAQQAAALWQRVADTKDPGEMERVMSRPVDTRDEAVAIRRALGLPTRPADPEQSV